MREAAVTIWVSVEGIEGAGKSYLAAKLAGRLRGRCALLAELTDQAASSMPGRIIGALSTAGDPFLRTGHPLTETLALIALKVREHEAFLRRPGSAPPMVLEDRGIDTVAVYQAIIFAGVAASPDQVAAVMRRIYETAAHWRPLPDATLLLTDDVDACIGRFEARTGRGVPAADRALIARAGELYAGLAVSHPGRFIVIDRAGRSEGEVLERMRAACAALLDGRCAR